MKTKASYKWCIFHINNKFYKEINSELRDRGYKHVRAVIPTVSILKKRQKGKDIYEDIPMLFNYGFIKMPTRLAYNRKFLNNLRKEIRGIHSWVKSLESMHPKRRRVRTENAEDHDDYSMVATVTRDQIKHFKKLQRENRAYSNSEVLSLTIGDYIVLRGYPFEGINATIEDVNHKNKTLKVVLYPGESGNKIVSKVSFENAIHSIYNNFDETLQCNQYEMDSSVITQEAIDDNLLYKQY